jgi:hypothetical protein
MGAPGRLAPEGTQVGSMRPRVVCLPSWDTSVRATVLRAMTDDITALAAAIFR